MEFNLLELIPVFLLFATMIWLCIYDFKYKAVPDYLLLLVFILSFFVSPFPFLDSLKYGMLFAGGFVLLNFVLTFYIQNIKSRIYKDESFKTQEALGEGDIPFIASMGIILGTFEGVVSLFLAALFAIIPSIYASFVKKDLQIHFIPYLFLGFLCGYFFDLEQLLKVYN